MLIEYVVFGALVVMALAATFVGMRRRRADRLSGDPLATFPYIAGGSAGTDGTHHPGHAGLGDGIDGGGGALGGGFEGGGGLDGGGDVGAGGGQEH